MCVLVVSIVVGCDVGAHIEWPWNVCLWYNDTILKNPPFRTGLCVYVHCTCAQVLILHVGPSHIHYSMILGTVNVSAVQYYTAIFNPRRACAVWVTVFGLCVRACLYLSVRTYMYSRTNKAAKKRYQQVQCHTGLIFKQVIFVKTTWFKSYDVERPICILPHLDQALLLCTESIRSFSTVKS